MVDFIEMISLNSELGQERLKESTALDCTNEQIIKNFVKQSGQTTCGLVSSCVMMNSCFANSYINEHSSFCFKTNFPELACYVANRPLIIVKNSSRNKGDNYSKQRTRTETAAENQFHSQNNNSATSLVDSSQKLNFSTNASDMADQKVLPTTQISDVSVDNELRGVMSSTSSMNPEKIVAQNSFLDVFIKTKINNIIDKVDKGITSCCLDNDMHEAGCYGECGMQGPTVTATGGKPIVETKKGPKVGPMKTAYTANVGHCTQSCGCSGGKGCCRIGGSGLAACEYKGPVGIGCDLGGSVGVGGVTGFGGMGIFKKYNAIKEAKAKAREATRIAKKNAALRAGINMSEIDKTDWDNVRLNADGEYEFMPKCNMDGGECGGDEENPCCIKSGEGYLGGCCNIMKKLNAGQYPTFSKAQSAATPAATAPTPATPPTTSKPKPTNVVTHNNNSSNNIGRSNETNDPDCVDEDICIPFPLTEETVLELPALKKVIDVERMKREGLTLCEVARLIAAFYFHVDINYADVTSIDRFRKDVQESFGPSSSSSSSPPSLSSSSKRVGVIVNYDHKVLDENCFFSGHHSPVAAYHPSSDSILLMDVWPSHAEVWVPLHAMMAAMNTTDASSKQSRGYLLVARCL
ncbi:hypothetical protein HELRODRAFT_194818 [Helobdella robusta]|uniref:glutathione gamma-glutamylcysteinyltransferase n=1 Tax=Helobdella robusta TaxID=6412 RepID=T1FWG3_HELRO|nr:hypothetical protein HELRODRAFT_194818 [Helobdella robusta]ESO11353.1 hypothetical protein HELRODRAFT_194818 [Helobdella robusta]